MIFATDLISLTYHLYIVVYNFFIYFNLIFMFIKAWIDVFGSRLAKAMGSFISILAYGDVTRLRNISEIPLLLLSLFIIFVTLNVGAEFDALIRARRVIGEELNPPSYHSGGHPGQHYDPYHSENSSAVHASAGGAGRDRNGLLPGMVGYDGYDLHLFDGVFDSDEDDEDEENSQNNHHHNHLEEEDGYFLENISLEDKRQSASHQFSTNIHHNINNSNNAVPYNSKRSASSIHQNHITGNRSTASSNGSEVEINFFGSTVKSSPKTTNRK